MLFYVLPALGVVLLYTTLRAWRRQHKENNMADTKQTGESIRRQVMGDAFVDRALGNATAFTQPLQDFVNEHAWGSVWAATGCR
jgi:hypothetical protein